MKIKFYSDLHVDINRIETPEQIFTKDEKVDYYLDAGDTGEYYYTNKFYSNNYWKNKKVIFISGNHLCYGSQIPIDEADEKLKTKFHLLNNVTYLQNSEYQLNDNISVLGTTLWTNFEVFGKDKKFACMKYAEKNMNDFNYAKVTKDSYLTPLATRTLFNIAFKFIKKKVTSNKNKKFIILTHHTPSLKSCLEKYKTDFLTGAFASNLEEFIFNNKNILLWLHGHVHNTSSYQIGETLIACNPLGYINYGEGFNFNSNLILDI